MNKVKDHYRKSGTARKQLLNFRDPEALVQTLEQVADETTPERAFLKDEESAFIRRIVSVTMAQLKEKDAYILHLRFSKQMTVKELASHMGIRHKAAEARLFRARSSFKSIFEKLCLEQSRRGGGTG